MYSHTDEILSKHDEQSLAHYLLGLFILFMISGLIGIVVGVALNV